MSDHLLVDQGPNILGEYTSSLGFHYIRNTDVWLLTRQSVCDEYSRTSPEILPINILFYPKQNLFLSRPLKTAETS